MSTTTDSHDDSQTVKGEHGYPFMTEEIDGEVQTYALFIPSSKGWYEPLPRGHPDVDPDTALTLKDPRTGETFDYEHGLSRHMQMVVGDHCVGHVSAERWSEFREEYLAADETDVDRANDFLDEHVFGYDD